MKHILTSFLTIILCLSFTLPAYGLTYPGPVGLPSTGEMTILSDTPDDLQKEIILLEEEEDLTAAHIPNNSLYPYLDINGKLFLLPVVWDTSAEELRSPGMHEVTATPVLSEGMELAEGFDGIVTWPIFRKGGDAKLTVTSLEQTKVSSPLLPLSGDPTTDLQLPYKVNTCITEDGYTLSTQNDSNFSWVWDISSIDASALGKYSITAQLNYPDWISISNELKTYTADIYVLPTDCIEIYAPTAISLNGVMDIRWLYDSDNITAPVLEQKKEDGTWEACEESWYTYAASVSAREYLMLHLFQMTKDTPLALRLRYQDIVNGESVERITKTIQMTIPTNIMELLAANASTIPITVIEGDRDGSDSAGTPLPDQAQPAPSRNKKKTTKSVTEIVTDTYTAISGQRVNTLANSGATVLFEKQKVSAEIPSKLLKGLNLKSQDLLEVILLRPSETSILVAVYAKGKLVENISGSTVFLPWDTKNGISIRCVDLWGNPVSNAAYDEKSRTLRFTVSKPNTYFLKKAPSHHPSPYADKGGRV
ncbi:hypothetical protein [Anaerotignum sp.]